MYETLCAFNSLCANFVACVMLGFSAQYCEQYRSWKCCKVFSFPPWKICKSYVPLTRYISDVLTRETTGPRANISVIYQVRGM